MSKHYPSHWLQTFIESAARLAWADWWAREKEERGYRFPPRTNIYDAAPATPEYAKVWAGMMVGQLEAANRYEIHALAARAHRADGHSDGIADPEKFGIALAFQTLHGASWFDDHKEFPLKVPHMEFNAG